MRQLLFLFIFIVSFHGMTYAQDLDYMERSDRVTLFKDYVPAVVTLAKGGVSRPKEANIFLKKSTLVYKKGKEVLEANMSVVDNVRFGNRTFINLNSQLAEVLDSIGNNMLVAIRSINEEGLTNEILSESSVTNLSLGDHVGVTRLDAQDDQLKYPVDKSYFFVVNGKKIPAQDRYARHAAGKKLMKDYEQLVKTYGFSWLNKDDLLNVLRLLSK